MAESFTWQVDPPENHGLSTTRLGAMWHELKARKTNTLVVVRHDTRFKGGFALFDAPEPWGPWTTVYFTDNWDTGPGDLACIPTKWISADGVTFHLVVASNDHFAVRKAKLITRYSIKE